MLPYFYHASSLTEGVEISLSADTSRHCISVLRMTQGAEMWVTDGMGTKARAVIKTPDKHRCSVWITETVHEPKREPELWLAVGLTKNRSRNEWFLEKAVEIGVDGIIPLQCMNSERERLNRERMTQVMIAAMIQSQQTRLPELLDLHTPLNAVQAFQEGNKGRVLIAHCEEGERRTLWNELGMDSMMILIGPEGDFNIKEIGACIDAGAVPVTLGSNRLRTETAAIYACTVFNQKNYAQ